MNALQYRSQERAYPNDEEPNGAHFEAYKYLEDEFRGKIRTRSNEGGWEAIGPWNTAGRMLSLAIHPERPNTILVGSASGGLWRSETFGADTSWQKISTGYPVTSVGAVAIATSDPDILLIGTGEVYNGERSGDGAAYRSTRGFPGIGILKSEDNGDSWELVLDWTRDQNQGVHHIQFGYNNDSLVYAATTDGVYISRDRGNTWSLSLDVSMFNDVSVSPDNDSIAIAVAGNFDSPDKGIYVTFDAGASWTKATGEIPDFNGKGRLDFARNVSGVAYASIGDGFSTSGPMATWTLRTDDYGLTWEEVSDVDYSRWQGWFAHDIAVDPTDSETIIGIGIYIHKSEMGGDQFEQVTRNPQVTQGRPPVGGPDGPLHYTHVDHHAVIYHPIDHDTVIVANDGGIFFSWDGGLSWESRNGGLQTTQFYNGISVNDQTTEFMIGGLQDNNSVIYDGSKAWTRTLGGDGAWTAQDADNPTTVFASYQFLNIFRSRDLGRNWRRLISLRPQDNPTFIAPFVLHPVETNVIYAATNLVYRSDDQGENWLPTNGDEPLSGNDPIYSMDVAPSDVDVVYAGTAPFNGPSSLWMTSDGGVNWERVGEGVLPDRYPVDITVDPNDAGRAIVTYSGYGTGHVFITEDFGETWDDITANLPDLPTNAAVIDDRYPTHIYVGNDISIFFSQNGGATWDEINEGLPEAFIVSDLKISSDTRKLFMSTHGNGAYMRDLMEPISTSLEEWEGQELDIFPTASADGRWTVRSDKAMSATIQLMDINGRMIQEKQVLSRPEMVISDDHLVKGTYIIKVIDKQSGRSTEQVVFKK